MNNRCVKDPFAYCAGKPKGECKPTTCGLYRLATEEIPSKEIVFSVLDYLRVDMSKTYEIGNALFAIFNKLNRGIAVVAMQKPPGERKLKGGE